MMDYAMLAVFALGCIAGFKFQRPIYAIAIAAVGGFGMAIAYYLWLGADPARGDALEGVGYLMAFAYPLSGCALGWLANHFSRKYG